MEDEPATPTELGKLFTEVEHQFSQLESRFARVERVRANNVNRLKILKNKHAEAVEQSVVLSQQVQELEAELNSSQVLLNDMEAHLTYFLGMGMTPAVE